MSLLIGYDIGYDIVMSLETGLVLTNNLPSECFNGRAKFKWINFSTKFKWLKNLKQVVA